MAKELTGTVVSLKMAKTAIVSVVTKTPHPLYKKIVRHTKRYKAHVEGVKLVEGDKVVISETRPISADKHFKVVKIIKY